MSDRLPPQIGRYRILDVAGRGGLAVVYRAHHPGFGEVALKLPQAVPGKRREIEQRFQSEIGMMRRLRHPHILRVLDAGSVTTADGFCQYYMATEFVRQGTLADLLRRSGGRLSEAAAIPLAIQIGEALAYAHSQGVIHRDIKPSNILLRGHAQAVLADFGIARALNEMTITLGRRVLGTLAYMSPEQTLGNRDLVRRGSDIYAFGLVLYEMLTGHQPRNNPELSDLVVTQMIHQQPLPRLTQIAPHVGADLAVIAHRCMEYRRENRYPSMDAVVAALREAAARRGIAAPGAPPRRPQARSDAWVLPVVIGVISLVLLAAFVAAVLLRGAPSREIFEVVR